MNPRPGDFADEATGMANGVAHFQINATDAERSVAFHRDVFGWDIQRADGPAPSWLVSTGSAQPCIDGGLFANFKDTEGNMVGLWQPASEYQPPVETQCQDGPHHRVGYFEPDADDVERPASFHRDVFG